MTREEHFIKKTQLLAQIDSAEKLGCKNVLKHARVELAKLEKKWMSLLEMMKSLHLRSK